MAKNMTRKGLALGSALALGVSALTAVPAVAAPSITVTPDKGTSYSFISGERFDLRVFGNSEFTAGFGELQWKITNASGAAVTATTTVSGDAVTDVPDSAASPAVSGVTTTSITVIPASVSTATGANKLGLSVAADKTVTLEVQAYIDVNGSDAYEAAFDLAAPAQTVSFIQAKDVAANLSITQPIEGDDKVAAEFTLNVNNEQLNEGDFAIYFTSGTDTDLSSSASDVVVAPGALSSTVTTFKSETATLSPVLAKNTAVKAQVVYNDGGVSAAVPMTYTTANGNVKVGSAVTSTVVTRTITGAVASVVRSATAVEASANSFHVSRNKQFEVKVTVENNTTSPAKPVAGVPVTIKVESTPTLSATAGSVKSVTVGGATYTDKTLLPGVTAGKTARLTGTTDADGVAKLAIQTTGFAVGEQLVVTFYAENFSSSVTVVSVNPAYTAKLADARDGVSTVDGTAAPVKVLVRDQFNGLPANGVYDITAEFVSSTQTTASDSDSATAAAVVNGEATLSILDNGTGTGTNTYDLNLATKSVTAGYSSIVEFSDDFEVRIVSEAARTAGAVTVTTGATLSQNSTTKIYTKTLSGTDADLNLKTLAAHDARTSLVDAPELGTATGADLSGTVTTLGSATSAALTIAGTPVTISGSGLMFRTAAVGGEYVYGVDSLTTMTDKNGAYTFEVFSNKAGKQTVTITAGTGSATVVLDAYDQADDNSATSLVITAPDAVSPGSTLTVSALLTDKYGNPVNTTVNSAANEADLKVSYTGPGLVVGSAVGTLTQETDADGKVGFYVLLGSADSGTATITISYDANGDADYLDADLGDLIVQKTVVIGTVGNVGEYSSWTKKLTDGSAKMYAKNVVGEGKVQFFLNGKEIAWVRATSANDPKLRTANGSAYLVRTVEFVEGQKNVLEIYVDGVRTTRTAYTY